MSEPQSATETHTHHHHLRGPGVVVIACLVVIVLSLFATVAYAAHVSSERKASVIAACVRGNLVREKQNALIRFLNDKLDYTGVPTPLIVCEDVP